MQFRYTADRSQATEHQMPGVECEVLHINGTADFSSATACCGWLRGICIIPGRYTVTATSVGRGASPKHDMKQEFTTGPKVQR